MLKNFIPSQTLGLLLRLQMLRPLLQEGLRPSQLDAGSNCRLYCYWGNSLGDRLNRV